MLGNAIEKNESDIANIVKKLHNFMRKTKNYLKKTWNDIEMLHPDFTEEVNEERPVGHVGVSAGLILWNLGDNVCSSLENKDEVINKTFVNIVTL